MSYSEVTTQQGGKGTPRRVELLLNGYWRVDWKGGIVSLYNDDPRNAFARGFEPERKH